MNSRTVASCTLKIGIRRVKSPMIHSNRLLRLQRLEDNNMSVSRMCNQMRERNDIIFFHTYKSTRRGDTFEYFLLVSWSISSNGFQNSDKIKRETVAGYILRNDTILKVVQRPVRSERNTYWQIYVKSWNDLEHGLQVVWKLNAYSM